MTYKLTDNNSVILSSEGINLTIPFAPGNRHYRKYQEWLAEGNTPEPADPLPPPSAEWREFLKSLRKTSVFSTLKSLSRIDIGANAIATELRTELGEAALGISTEGDIQPLLNELSVGLTTSQKQEISDLIDIHHIPLIISVGIAST